MGTRFKAATYMTLEPCAPVIYDEREALRALHFAKIAPANGGTEAE
jgi:hypothetical protein